MIEEKLQKCRVELQNKKLKKTGENKFAKFKYFELGDFIPEVNKMFYENKIFSNFSICGDYAALVITDCEDKSIQTFTSNIAEGDVKGCTAIQSLGAVHTYLKRYLYLNALEIVESDLLDSSLGVKDDEQYYLAVSKITSIEELNNYWKQHKNEVQDAEQFKNICASRKAVIKEEAG